MDFGFFKVVLVEPYFDGIVMADFRQEPAV